MSKRYFKQWLDENEDGTAVAEFKAKYPVQFKADWRPDEWAWHIVVVTDTTAESARIWTEYTKWYEN